MKALDFEEGLEFARKLDAEDPLKGMREAFAIPVTPSGEAAYFCGNSLGLQPLKARDYVNEELDDWARYGVEGHIHARHPWMPYHEFLTEPMARVVGAMPSEVVVMNTLTVNLHLMMVSFYRPTRTRYRILVEGTAFPSDQYAVRSQAEFHARNVGFDPAQAILELLPRAGESAIRTEDILATIEREGDSIALVLLGQVNYVTGQAFEVREIARAARAKGCAVGIDAAHGAGNLELGLHDSGLDFAVWCTYKYLNGGPGCLAGAFVHERHARDASLPRLAGWWGHDKKARFRMEPGFKPMDGAEGWQLSNPPILPMASLRASLELFDQAGMSALRAKSLRLTAYLEYLLEKLPKGTFEMLTPRDPAQRGCQLSLRVLGGRGKEMVGNLGEKGVICDFREPDVIRAAPVPLYTRFEDVHRFHSVVKEGLAHA